MEKLIRKAALIKVAKIAVDVTICLGVVAAACCVGYYCLDNMDPELGGIVVV